MSEEWLDLYEMEADALRLHDGESSGGFAIVRDPEACYGCDTHWRLESHVMPLEIVLPYVCGWRPGVKDSVCGVVASWQEH